MLAMRQRVVGQPLEPMGTPLQRPLVASRRRHTLSNPGGSQWAPKGRPPGALLTTPGMVTASDGQKGRWLEKGYGVDREEGGFRVRE